MYSSSRPGYPQQQQYGGYPPGYPQGQNYPPGYPQGQNYPPGYPQGQNYPPGYPQGQNYPSGYRQPNNYPAPPPQGDEESYTNTTMEAFLDQNVRRGFIRKVYFIVGCQLIVTSAIVAIFVFSTDSQQWVKENPAVIWVAFGVQLATMLILACCGDFRRKTPMNYVCLGIFTLAESFLVGVIASKYEVGTVFMALGITTVLTFGLTVFAFQTKCDFTVCGGILCVAMLLLMVMGIVTIFFPSKILRLVYCSLGALLFCFYLIYDTQMMMGGKHKYAISPEEYVFAALSIYLDIIMIFLYILRLFSSND